MRNLIVLSLVSFFQDVSSEMIFPIITYIIAGYGIYYFGIMEGVAELTSNILKLFSGRIYDRFSKAKPLVFSGYFLSTLGKSLYLFPFSPLIIILGRFIDRLGKGIRTSPRDALLSLSVKKEYQGRVFGIHRFSDTLGAITGPLILIFLVERLSPKSIILLALIPALLALFLILFVVEVRKVRIKPSHFSLILPGNLLIIFSLTALANISVGFFLLESPSLRQLPITYLLFNIFYALSSLIAGYLYDRLGFKIVFSASLILLLIADATMIILGNPYIPIIPFSIFYGIYDTVPKAHIGKIVGNELKGSAYGNFYFITGLCLFIGNISAGFLSNLVNHGEFIFSGIFASVSLLILHINKHR